MPTTEYTLTERNDKPDQPTKSTMLPYGELK